MSLNKIINSDNNILSYDNKQIQKKGQIPKIKNKINNLVLNKNSLLSLIDNKPLVKKCISPHYNSNNKLFLSFQNIQNQNIFNDKINKTDKFEDIYTIKYKLLNAQKEIDNLKKINKQKDIIIMNIQNFLNNINHVICEGRINLDLNKIDIKTLIINLKKLEQKMISKIRVNNNPNKINKLIINKVINKPIKKQKTEFSLNSIKNMEFIPYINSSNSKISTQTYINNTKYSNNSLNEISLNKNYYNSVICHKIIKNMKKMNLSGISREKKLLKLKTFC